ncbi:hypothetical protein FACS189419_00190 [Planctomycetales bacterium]|nr:hypothetical protein FACS189419_00190 [Planctomycetales bacterium]
MRNSVRLKNLVEWTSLGIFLLVILIAVAYCKGNDGDWQSTEELEASKTADNGDIADRFEKPKKSGAVWGKADNTGTKPVSPAAASPAAAAPKSARLAAKSPVNTETISTDSLSKEKFLLKSRRTEGSTDLVETLLEVTGTVKQIGSNPKPNDKPVDNKMEVIAGFRYEERIGEMSSSGGGKMSIRQYNLAKSKMKIGDRTKLPELEERLQTIVCSLEKDKVNLFSPSGSLRGEQLLLIEDLPGNTLTIDRLLPNREVAVGESWKLQDSVLRSFISVDAVTESNVTAVLTAVTDDMAMVEVVGDIDGVYLGAATEMHIRAKYQFDIKAKRINWVGLLIEEDRSIGHVGPGLDLVAKVQVKISPLAEPQALSDETIALISTEPTEQILKLKYDGGKGPWRFSHPRSWYVFQDDPQATILRKLEKGELIAQCNIADMGTVDVKTMTSIDKFQQDLIKGLKDNFGRVVSAQEFTSKSGYKVYHVILDGTVDDLQLRWVYNLLTDGSGHQSVVVFVVEADKLEQFGNSDEELLSTYRMGK